MIIIITSEYTNGSFVTLAFEPSLEHSTDSSSFKELFKITQIIILSYDQLLILRSKNIFISKAIMIQKKKLFSFIIHLENYFFSNLNSSLCKFLSTHFQEKRYPIKICHFKFEIFLTWILHLNRRLYVFKCYISAF